MRIPYGSSSYERARGDLPSLPVINMVAEPAPTEETGVVLQSRPPLADLDMPMGDGPVTGLFRRDGVLGDSLFGVSGGHLYTGADDLGAIDGDGPVSMAGYENFLFVAAAAGLWGYNGTSLAAIAFPDGANVSKVLVGASRAIAVRADTGKFYWSDPLEDDIEALDFATAENQPDRLRDALFIDDILVLFGAETIEFWPNTGSATLPFQPLEGRVIERGIKATGCATSYGSTFVWVTNENQVCMGDENNVISNPGLQARIGAATKVSLFSFLNEGAEYLALRLDDETQVWANSLWSEFTSYGQDNWLPQCWSDGVFGSAVDGTLYAWGTTYDDEEIFERRFRAGFVVNSGGVTVANLQVRCNVGQTDYLVDDYAEPVIEMRLSRDAGKTWGAWRDASLGRQGEYRTKVQWRALGMASQPAFLAEFRVTGAVDFRLSDVLVNEEYGGR